MVAALGWGALAASSLVIGAVLAFARTWSKTQVGSVLAFGAGALISAVSFELVEEGVTGLLHRPGDAGSLADCLRRIASGADRNREMGRAARRRYDEGFSPAVGLARLVEEYRAAIAARSGGGVRPGCAPKYSTRLARSSAPPIRLVPLVKAVNTSPPSARKFSVPTR